ncbi:hypothetical protein GF386_03785 [Candidatus Pacearchaeota archaeon]|nr:hypothetical protein [Candidatus Pacearchaeota archaeon]
MKKQITKLNVLTILFIVLLAVPFASSLGITPGRTVIDYESGLEKDISFSVLNNEKKNMKVLLTVSGDLNESITLYDNLIEFKPGDESKSFKYKIKLPDSLSNKPGLHTADIVALEVPEANAEGAFVGATVAVVSQVHVNVPCAGKCIDAELDVLDAQSNGSASFIVTVINRGKLGIGDVRAVIDIYTPLNEKVKTIETDYRSLEAGKSTALTGKWKVEVPSGNYLAKVTVFYDGESQSFEKQFVVGDEILSIESILVNNFRLGEIAKLQILVENKWNKDLKSVFANLIVYNEDNQVMTDIKSASEDIPSLTKKELIAYWDTVGVNVGEYSGKLMVRYDGKSTDKNLVLKVNEDSLDVFGVGYAVRPQGTKGVNITFILIVLVVILLVVNLAWFIFFRRMMGKKK